MNFISLLPTKAKMTTYKLSKILGEGAEETAQWLRACTTFPEDLSSIPSNHS